MLCTSTKNIDEIITDILERSKTILSNEPIFDVQIPHVINAQKWNLLNRSKNSTLVYIYYKNNMVKGSPFISYSAAHTAIGLKPSSNTCGRYIDTDKLYKNKYRFSSKPITFL